MRVVKGVWIPCENPKNLFSTDIRNISLFIRYCSLCCTILNLAKEIHHRVNIMVPLHVKVPMFWRVCVSDYQSRQLQVNRTAKRHTVHWISQIYPCLLGQQSTARTFSCSGICVRNMEANSTYCWASGDGIYRCEYFTLDELFAERLLLFCSTNFSVWHRIGWRLHSWSLLWVILHKELENN